MLRTGVCELTPGTGEKSPGRKKSPGKMGRRGCVGTGDLRMVGFEVALIRGGGDI
jgi:hypothetical protein